MLRSGRVWFAGLALAAVALSSRVSAADPKYFPGDTEIVFTINVKQILESDLIKANKEKLDQVKEMIKNAIPGDNQAQKLLEKAGFDPFKDFGSLTVAMPPTKDGDAVFVLIEGNFNPKKVEDTAVEAAKDHGDVLKITKHGKYKVFEITPPGEKKVYAALVNNTTMLICANDENMKGALARAAGTKKSLLKKEITSLLSTTSNKQSISFVTTGSAIATLAKDAPVPNPQMLDTLKNIEGISGALTIAKDVQLQLGISTSNAETAKDLANKANTGLNLARFFIGQQAQKDERLQPVADAVKTLRATAMGNNLIVRGELSFENIQKLLKSFAPN